VCCVCVSASTIFGFVCAGTSACALIGNNACMFVVSNMSLSKSNFNSSISDTSIGGTAEGCACALVLVRVPESVLMSVLVLVVVLLCCVVLVVAVDSRMTSIAALYTAGMNLAVARAMRTLPTLHMEHSAPTTHDASRSYIQLQLSH
jgi:hypothetical protein